MSFGVEQYPAIRHRRQNSESVPRTQTRHDDRRRPDHLPAGSAALKVEMAGVLPGQPAASEVERRVEGRSRFVTGHRDRTHGKVEILSAKLVIDGSHTPNDVQGIAGRHRGRGRVVLALPVKQEVLHAGGHRRTGRADAGNADHHDEPGNAEHGDRAHRRQSGLTAALARSSTRLRAGAGGLSMLPGVAGRRRI